MCAYHESVALSLQRISVVTRNEKENGIFHACLEFGWTFAEALLYVIRLLPAELGACAAAVFFQTSVLRSYAFFTASEPLKVVNHRRVARIPRHFSELPRRTSFAQQLTFFL